MAGIQVSGLGSGLDINSLVTQLVSAEVQPASTRLDRREASLQTQLSAIGTFKGVLSDLKGAVSALTSTSMLERMKATVGDESLFTASTDSTAQIGSYGIEVKNLAQAHKMASSRFSITSDDLATTTVSTGDLSFDFDGDGESDVKVDAADTTLGGIRDAINQADIGVRANIVNDGGGYRLTFSAIETGTAKALDIAVTGSDVPAQLQVSEDPADIDTSLHTTVAAQDAEVIIDGLKITSASNTVTGVLDGVTLNLKTAKEGTTTNLTITKGTAEAIGSVQALVDAYNKFTGTVSSLTSYNATTQQGGTLLGDASVRSISGQVRSALGGWAGDISSALHTLSEIGVTFQKDGKLSLDKSRFEAVLGDDPQAVADLFAGSNGIAAKLDQQLDGLLKSDGPLNSRTTAINKQIDQIGDQREILNRRIESLETRYRTQFTALDQLVSQLTTTGNYLTQQLANLPGFGE